jgi:hypothetical protein
MLLSIGIDNNRVFEIRYNTDKIEAKNRNYLEQVNSVMVLQA